MYDFDTLEMLTQSKEAAIRYWEEEVTKLMAAGASARKVAEFAGVSHVTVYRVFKARKQVEA